MDHEPEGQDEFVITPEDDMEALNEKLRQSKAARKRADEDAKLLANRIKLLQNEESKARKKIKETKKRATDIVTTRKRNLTTAKQKRA